MAILKGGMFLMSDLGARGLLVRADDGQHHLEPGGLRRASVQARGTKKGGLIPLQGLVVRADDGYLEPGPVLSVWELRFRFRVSSFGCTVWGVESVLP